ncbi:hypothetical protein A9R00_03860 [Oleispira antarctica]|uniref:DUF695 domain-containing protein n=1 Tax=Oleispira antarctica TaxID=188908 RepID=A0A1Y5HU88_OLEAN|nr:hypothetical protein A9R00_03860 [Oleispira antarctica]
MKLDNRWVTADGTLNELPITIYSREDWQVLADKGSFPICIQIAWHAEQRDESNAYPSRQDMLKIDVFHHQLQSQIEADSHAVVAMVITHDGVNQWVIYCDDIETVKAGLNKLSAPEQGFPIEIVADEDAGWETFKKVHQAIQ